VENIVAAMRKQRGELCEAYKELDNATVVYEVFSNRAAPKGETKLTFTNLEKHERVVVIRGEHFASALGDVLADMRQVKRVKEDDSERD
jgi:hypothetical protein